jgi:hypothetical protein
MWSTYIHNKSQNYYAALDEENQPQQVKGLLRKCLGTDRQPVIFGVRGADHKTNRVADLLWELNFIVTIILTVPLLGKTVVFNAAPDGLGRINGQKHLNQVFGPSKIAV